MNFNVFKTIFSVFFLMLSLSTVASTKEGAVEDHIDSLANRLFDQNQFDKARMVLQRKLQMVNEAGGVKDLSYIQRLDRIAKCWNRMEQMDSAVSVAQQVVDLYSKNICASDKQYAKFLDRLSLYQVANKDYKGAMENCQKALEIFENFKSDDYDKALVLMHTAEVSWYLGKNADAISYELRGLNIVKNFFGEHSKEYVGEASYLRKYYEANGDKGKAKSLADRLSVLLKETAEGRVDLPQIVDLTSWEVAHAHNRDVQRYIEYYLSRHVSDARMDEARHYIMHFAMVSKDVSFIIGRNEKKIASSGENQDWYYTAMIAACCEYALKTGKKDYTYDMFEYALCRVLNFYEANIRLTGENKYLEKFLDAYVKDKDTFVKLLKEAFAKQKM